MVSARLALPSLGETDMRVRPAVGEQDSQWEMEAGGGRESTQE